MNLNNHPFHIVTYSPWPLILSINILNIFLRNLIFFYNKNFYYILFIIINILIYILIWWQNVIYERTFQGIHTKYCKYIIKFSIIIFIISEIIFFISIFWCYLHIFLSPNIEIGEIWPPKSIILFNPYKIPLINTIILISSGITLTYSHNLILNNKKNLRLNFIKFTIYLGILFTIFQLFEYKSSRFSFSDSIFGSIFFILTGFHGIHVIIGTIFLIYIIILIKNQFSNINNLGYELRSWYWHFVDLIWLILYSLIYWWSY